MILALLLLACSPALNDSAADPIDSTPALCSSCESHGDGTYTIHVYPGLPMVETIGDAFEGPHGLGNARVGIEGAEVVWALPVLPGEMLVNFAAETDGNPSIVIERDPPLIPEGQQGSTGFVAGTNCYMGCEIDINEVVEPGAEYVASVWLPLEATTYLTALDVLVEE